MRMDYSWMETTVMREGQTPITFILLNREHVCQVNVPITYTITVYYATAYMSGYTTCCNFLCLARCQRFR